jgi:hypothetical protein
MAGYGFASNPPYRPYPVTRYKLIRVTRLRCRSLVPAPLHRSSLARRNRRRRRLAVRQKQGTSLSAGLPEISWSSRGYGGYGDSALNSEHPVREPFEQLTAHRAKRNCWHRSPVPALPEGQSPRVQAMQQLPVALFCRGGTGLPDHPNQRHRASRCSQVRLRLRIARYCR